MIAITVVALLATGAGCALIRKESPISRSDASPADDREKQWDGKIRHDQGPLNRRFKNLGGDYTATWAGGLYGINADRGLPSPDHRYWVDAVIRLNPTTARELEGKLGDSVSHETPNVKKELRGELPPGAASTSRALDEYINSESDLDEHGSGTGYLYPEQNVLVVTYMQVD